MKFLRPFAVPAAFALLTIVPARAQATLYGIGDLAGGKVYSEVRDATRVGGVIYAVGGSTATSATNNNDRAVIWTSSGGLTAIPDFVNNTVGTGGVFAAAITPDGSAIAARLHNNATLTPTQAAYVTTSGPTATALGVLAGGVSSGAAGISDSGLILYGTADYPGGSGKTQLVRYTNSAGSISAVGLPGGVTNMFFPGQQSVSADGNRVVGIANNGGAFTTAGSTAFLYIHSDPGNGGLPDLSMDVPNMTGGTWTAGMALNSAGTLGLIAGNSTAYPNGAVFLYNDTTNTLLGSPNASYNFVGGGSLNADGSLVTAAFNAGGPLPLGYIHNANGWYSLDSVAGMLGADMTGWSNLNVFGMSSDATLLWGNGLHNGNVEGFVLDVSGGSLAAIPEPSTYAAFAGLGALGLAAWRRRRLARPTPAAVVT